MATSLIPNGDFEATGGWTTQDFSGGLATATWGRVTTDAHAGSASYEINVSASTYTTVGIVRGAFSDLFTVLPSTPYDLSWWFKTTNANLVGSIRVIWYTAGGGAVLGQAVVPSSPSAATPDTWTECEAQVISHASAETCRLTVVAYQRAASQTGTVHFDDVTMFGPSPIPRTILTPGPRPITMLTPH